MTHYVTDMDLSYYTYHGCFSQKLSCLETYIPFIDITLATIQCIAHVVFATALELEIASPMSHGTYHNLSPRLK